MNRCNSVDPSCGAAYRGRMMYTGVVSSLVVVSIIVIIKAVAFLLSGSVAVLGALFDSVLDSLVSVLNLLAVRFALSPPDSEYRFGHGKVEAVASFTQSFFIFGSAIYLAYESVVRLFHPEPLENMDVVLAVAGVSIVLTIGLILVQAYVVRVTQSVLILADSLHYKGDLFINVSVIVSSVAAAAFGSVRIDSILGLVIALFLAVGAVRILRASLRQLLDRELTGDYPQIESVILSHPEVLGFHELRTRQSSIRKFIQFHLDLDPNLSLRQAHIVAQEVEGELLSIFPGAEIMIHQDPHGHDVHDSRAKATSIRKDGGGAAK